MYMMKCQSVIKLFVCMVLTWVFGGLSRTAFRNSLLEWIGSKSFINNPPAAYTRTDL
jgi:hypothetical protein